MAVSVYICICSARLYVFHIAMCVTEECDVTQCCDFDKYKKYDIFYCFLCACWNLV